MLRAREIDGTRTKIAKCLREGRLDWRAGWMAGAEKTRAIELNSPD